MLAGACILWERPESALKVLQEMIATGQQFPEVYAMAAKLLLKSQWDEGMPSAELLDEVPAKFNRLVFYSGDLPHGACIRHPERLQDDPLTGRLSLNTFVAATPV